MLAAESGTVSRAAAVTKADVVVLGATREAAAVAREAELRGLVTILVDHDTKVREADVPCDDLLKRLGALQYALRPSHHRTAEFRAATRSIWRDVGLAGDTPASLSISSGRTIRRRARAEFLTSSELSLSTGERLRAPSVVIATGAQPRRPERFDFSRPTVCDSRSILHDQVPPRSVVIVGADWSGCEWAFALALAGSQVVLIDRRTRLLRGLDADMRLLLQTTLHDLGVVVVLGEEIISLEDQQCGGCRIRLSSGRDELAETVLILAGGVANTNDLGLDLLGVNRDLRGHVIVDDQFRSSVAGVFAIGPATDPMGLATSVSMQAKMVVDVIVGAERDWVGEAPWVLRSSVEVGMCGLSEEACGKLGIPIAVGRAASPSATGACARAAKVIAASEDGRILGAQILGERAAEAIHIASTSLGRAAPVEECAGIACAQGTAMELLWDASRAAVAALEGGARTPQASQSITEQGSEPPGMEEDWSK